MYIPKSFLFCLSVLFGLTLLVNSLPSPLDNNEAAHDSHAFTACHDYRCNIGFTPAVNARGDCICTPLPAERPKTPNTVPGQLISGPDEDIVVRGIEDDGKLCHKHQHHCPSGFQLVHHKGECKCMKHQSHNNATISQGHAKTRTRHEHPATKVMARNTLSKLPSPSHTSSYHRHPMPTTHQPHTAHSRNLTHSHPTHSWFPASHTHHVRDAEHSTPAHTHPRAFSPKPSHMTTNFARTSYHQPANAPKPHRTFTVHDWKNTISHQSRDPRHTSWPMRETIANPAARDGEHFSHHTWSRHVEPTGVQASRTHTTLGWHTAHPTARDNDHKPTFTMTQTSQPAIAHVSDTMKTTYGTKPHHAHHTLPVCFVPNCHPGQIVEHRGHQCRCGEKNMVKKSIPEIVDGHRHPTQSTRVTSLLPTHTVTQHRTTSGHHPTKVTDAVGMTPPSLPTCTFADCTPGDVIVQHMSMPCVCPHPHATERSLKARLIVCPVNAYPQCKWGTILSWDGQDCFCNQNIPSFTVTVGDSKPAPITMTYPTPTYGNIETIGTTTITTTVGGKPTPYVLPVCREVDQLQGCSVGQIVRLSSTGINGFECVCGSNDHGAKPRDSDRLMPPPRLTFRSSRSHSQTWRASTTKTSMPSLTTTTTLSTPQSSSPAPTATMCKAKTATDCPRNVPVTITVWDGHEDITFTVKRLDTYCAGLKAVPATGMPYGMKADDIVKQYCL